MNKVQDTIEKLVPSKLTISSQLPILKSRELYKGPLFYHGSFYVLENYNIIMGGMIMELSLREIGPGKLFNFLKYKTIIDEYAKDIIFPPDNSIILFKEKKKK